MGEVFPMPAVGDLFTDMRGGDRRMRVSYHEDRGAVVVSLWADTVCKGTFQLGVPDVSRLVALLSHVERSAATPSVPDDVVETSPPPDQTGDVSRTPRVA
ncbi:hypothetical protein AB0M54_44455 [Actinoplanes sp. NPDC051470]|uniref:hypothetical protein n=1 Tax=unclassified Actinoplanes TaxID=2626549 RepID=UPI00344855E4